MYANFHAVVFQHGSDKIKEIDRLVISGVRPSISLKVAVLLETCTISLFEMQNFKLILDLPNQTVCYRISELFAYVQYAT